MQIRQLCTLEKFPQITRYFIQRIAKFHRMKCLKNRSALCAKDQNQSNPKNCQTLIPNVEFMTKRNGAVRRLHQMLLEISRESDLSSIPRVLPRGYRSPVKTLTDLLSRLPQNSYSTSVKRL